MGPLAAPLSPPPGDGKGAGGPEKPAGAFGPRGNAGLVERIGPVYPGICGCAGSTPATRIAARPRDGRKRRRFGLAADLRSASRDEWRFVLHANSGWEEPIPRPDHRWAKSGYSSAPSGGRSTMSRGANGCFLPLSSGRDKHKPAPAVRAAHEGCAESRRVAAHFPCGKAVS